MIRTKNKSTFFTLSIVFLILSLWICNHFYLGIRHDGRLYTLQALSHLHPDQYNKDIFLENKSQDRFTIFSRIQAIFIRYLNVSTTHILLVCTGNILFLLSLYCLLKVFLEFNEILLAIILITILPNNYGGLGVFTYSETFLTPRLFSECFSLIALFFFYSKQNYKALAFCAFSTILHPIMGIICLSIIVIDHLWYHRDYKKYIVFSAIALLLLIFAILGPFSEAFVRMDPEWFGIVSARSPHLLLSKWFTSDWVSFFTSILMILLVYFYDRQRTKHFVVICVVSLFFFLISFIGGDLLKIVFILQIQLWRIHWLLNIFAYISFAILLWKLKDGNVLQYCGILLISLGWFKYSTATLCLMASGTVIFICGQVFRDFFERIKVLYSKYVLAAITLFYLENLLHPRIIEFINKSDYFLTFPAKPYSYLAVFSVIMSLLIVFLLFIAIMHKFPVLTLLLSVLMLSFCIFIWDQRDDGESLLFSDNPEITSIRDNLNTDQNFLWPGNPLGTWILFERPNYISPAQGAGAVFSRKTALEYKRRMHNTRNLVQLLRSHYYGMLSIKDILTEFSATDNSADSKLKDQLYAGLSLSCEHNNDLRYIIIPDQLIGKTAIFKISFQDITLRNPLTGVCNNYDQVNLYLYDCEYFKN